VIAAANRNLDQAVGDGKFRVDPFYCLNVIPIEVPPLRERKSAYRAAGRGFSARSLQQIIRYS
jgi:transcriptional regulator with GAF, ATPase, and Fis domain